MIDGSKARFILFIRWRHNNSHINFIGFFTFFKLAFIKLFVWKVLYWNNIYGLSYVAFVNLTINSMSAEPKGAKIITRAFFVFYFICFRISCWIKSCSIIHRIIVFIFPKQFGISLNQIM